MNGEWEGGKGPVRRRGSSQKKYEDGWELAYGKPKINSVVRLTDYSEEDINSHARVTSVNEHGVIVTNMNMPFQGTLSDVFIPNGKFQK